MWAVCALDGGPEGQRGPQRVEIIPRGQRAQPGKQRAQPGKQRGGQRERGPGGLRGCPPEGGGNQRV